MDREELKGELPFFFLLFLVSLFLIIADQRRLISPVRLIVERPIIALERPLYLFSQSINQPVNQVINSGKRDQELVELEGKLRQLAIDQNQLSSCLEENEHLRRLLSAPLSPQWQFVDAKVVGRTEKMRLYRGKRDGIKEGMMVVSENILVGKVISVGEVDCLVQLPTDPNSKIPVVVKKPASSGIQARGLLIGQFGGKIILDRVLQDEDIQKGDLVITSGEEGWLPDLVIGQVGEVSPKTAAVYQQATVYPLVDYSLLRIVFVVIP